MSTKLILLLTIWSFCAFNLSYCAVASIHKADNSNQKNTTEFELPYLIRSTVELIYKTLPDDFDFTLNFADKDIDINFNADFLMGIFYALNESQHTEVALQAVALHNRIERFISANSTRLRQDRVQALELIQEEHLWNFIIAKGSQLLVAAVNNHSSSLEDTVAGKLLDNLHSANKTLSSRTFKQMVAEAHLLLTAKDLTPILANLSKYTEQNVQFLLALYDEKLQEEEKIAINRYLQQLKMKTDYENVAAEDKTKVDAILLNAKQL